MDTRYGTYPLRRTQHNITRHNAVRRMPTAHEKRRNKSHTGPVGMFFITLLSVLMIGSIGIVALTLPKYLAMHSEEEVSFVSYVEAIPQTLVMETVEIEPVVEEEVVDTSKYGKEINDPEYLSQNNIFLKDGSTEDSVTLGFVGDILLDDEYAVLAAMYQRGGQMSDGISQVTLDEMNGVDVMVVNNEFPFTERGTRQVDKQYTFHADYNTSSYLNDMGADVAILANNHVFDYGEQGLLDTLDTLNAAGVHPVGAGRNIDEAARPVYYIVNDIKIAIVAATQIERMSTPNTIGATEDKPGVFRCWQSNRIYSAIAEAKENADYVIACIHWGTEKDPVPDSWQLEMAPKLAEAGADLIIGDHTHRLQGVYYYGDTPCFYSLGNFWFNGFSIDTGMVEVTFTKDGMSSLKFLPAIQQNSKTGLVFEGEKTRIISYLRSLSKGAFISDDGYILKEQ